MDTYILRNRKDKKNRRGFLVSWQVAYVITNTLHITLQEKDLNQIYSVRNRGQKAQGRYEYEMILAQPKLCVIGKILSEGNNGS